MSNATISQPAPSTIQRETRASLRASLYDRTTSPQRAMAALALEAKWEKGLRPVRMEVAPEGPIYLFVPFVCPVNGNFYVDIYEGARAI
jgi:hypothetical protein